MTNRLALVLGGGNGLGRASARSLAEAGFTVAIADLSADAAEEVVRSLPGLHHRSFQGDIAVEDQVFRLFESVERDLGPVQVMANFAGLLIAQNGEKTGLTNTTVAEWDDTFAVNARGSFLVVREMLRRRRAAPLPHARHHPVQLACRAGGRLSRQRSLFSLQGCRVEPDEGCRAGRCFNRPDGKRDRPGLIETRMLRLVYSEQESKQAESAIPLGRVGLPSEIAAVVTFLASEGADYITGATLDVNGGLRMQ